MDSVTITVVSNRFPEIADRFPVRVSDAVGVALFKVLEEADPRTPRDTGNLAGGAMVRFSPGAFEGAVFWPALYAGFVNFGTRFMAPRRFATDAADIVGPQLIQALSQIGEGL